METPVQDRVRAASSCPTAVTMCNPVLQQCHQPDHVVACRQNEHATPCSEQHKKLQGKDVCCSRAIQQSHLLT